MTTLNFQFKKDTTPLWKDQQDIPQFPVLKNDLEVDTCIIGGGIAGLTTAYLLSKQGQKVCVLEMLQMGEGQTCRTSAHLVTALDRRYEGLLKIHGKEKTQLAAESHRTAIEKIEEICRTENIDCDFRYLDGYLCAADDEEVNIIDKEFEACQKIGMTDVLKASPSPFFKCKSALHFPRQAQFHAGKYIQGLLRTLENQNVLLYQDTLVSEVHDGPKPHVITQAGYCVRAKNILVATNSPMNNTFALHTKQAPYRSYVIAALIPKGSFPILCWDTEDPFHYVRSQEFNSTADILLVGGEDHKTGQNDHPEKCFERLESWARERFPEMQEVIYSWSGQVMETVDGLAYLGRNVGEKNIYVITGDSGNGLTHGTLGAMLISDLIQEIPNPWEEIYEPSRIHFSSFKDFVKENANVAAQYAEWLNPQSLASLDKLPLNEGTVLNLGLRKIAVYKNDYGLLDFHSAVCPHLGCVVNWNGVEKSWDCPCHGSRFDCHGKLLEGPAQTDLSEIEAPKDEVPEGIPLRPSAP